jgi:hypothetical protein
MRDRVSEIVAFLKKRLFYVSLFRDTLTAVNCRGAQVVMNTKRLSIRWIDSEGQSRYITQHGTKRATLQDVMRIVCQYEEAQYG